MVFEAETCRLCVARLWSRVVEGVVRDVYNSRRMGESKSPCEPAHTIGVCQVFSHSCRHA